MYIAKSMGRKGYANEGAVTEEEQLPIELSAAPPSKSITPSSLARRWTPPEDTIAENIGPKASEFMQSYPAKLAQGVMNAPSAAYEGMKYPGQLLYGEKEYDPEEAVQWSGGLATNMLGASSPFALAKMPTAAEAASTTRVFAGLAADTADVTAYRAAKAAKDAGVSPDKIWKEHGWGWTRDDKPFFEISDEKAALKPKAKEWFEESASHQAHLGDILHHPEFFAAYPESARMPVTMHSDVPQLGQARGGYWEDPKFGYMHKSELEVRQPTPEKALSTLMHELNHGVQGYENFPRGANPSAIKQEILADIQKRMDEVLYQRAQYEEAITKAPDDATRIKMRDKIVELTETYKDISQYKNVADLDSQAYREYWKTHGEASSRNVQHRLDMPADERRQVHPRHTLDVPEEELILRYPRADGGGIPEVIDLETETPDAGGYPDVIDLETPMPEGTDTGSSPMSYAPDDEPAEQPRALAAIAKIAPQAKKPVPVEQPYATAPAPMSRADETWGRMLQQESNRQHFDESGRPKISSAGAVGIAQVKPATGKEAAALAGEPWNFKRFHSDPEYNERLGRAYYDQQLQRFGDPTLAAAAYNAGPSRLSRALDLAQSTGRDVSNFLPAETRKYMRGASSFAKGGSALPLPKNATGNAIADRAIMLLSKKAKRQPGRG